MNVIVHYPESETDMSELQDRVAHIHAQAVITYLSKLTCSNEQKIALIDSVIQAVKFRPE